jgi:serine/threonine protein kinase
MSQEPSRPITPLHPPEADGAVRETPADGSVLWPGSDTDSYKATDFRNRPTTEGDSSAPSPQLASSPSLVPNGPVPFERLGHYQVLERLGGGGMGDVYQGYDPSLDRHVAIKVLRADLARDEECVRRFHTEAATVARLDHPHIVAIYFSGEDGGRHFFAMQFIEGESLLQRLSRVGKLPAEESLAIASHCLAGLATAHAQGLIHRDIKPGNILIDARTGNAVLVDFGLVRRQDDSQSPTAAGVIMGTVAYVAPEQARGQEIDARADIYALGVVLYQMLSGRLPFDSETPVGMIFQHAYEEPQPLGELVPDLPEPVLALVARMMAKDPAQRYQTCGDVLDDLRHVRRGSPDPAGLRPSVGPVSRSGDRDTARAGRGSPDPALGSGDLAADEFQEPFPLPERVSQLASFGPWQRFRDWAATMFRRGAPQFVQELQGTTQQVDGAVAAYERRCNRLARLVEEGRAILPDIARQIESNQQARAAEEQRAESASTDDERQAALARRQPLDESVAALARQHEEQARQVEDLEAQLGTAAATLARLRSQRDSLRARLRAAEARQQWYGQDPERRQTTWALWVFAGGCLALAALGLALVAVVVHVALRPRPLISPQPEETRAEMIPVVPVQAPASGPATVEEPTPIEMLVGCTWVWYPEGHPEFGAPVGTRYFRNQFAIPSGPQVRRARFALTADDGFTLYVNGQQVAETERKHLDWQRVNVVDLAEHLKPGVNQLAIEGENTPNAGQNRAGLVGRVHVEFETGVPLSVPTDATWKVADREQPGWTAASFDDRDWPAAKELVPFGGGGWGWLAGPPPRDPGSAGKALPLGEWLDLLPSVDLGECRLEGVWRQDGQTLTADAHPGHACLSLPAWVVGSYELEIDYTLAVGSGAWVIQLPVGEKRCAVTFNSHLQNVDGIEVIDGQRALDNPTRTTGSVIEGQKSSLAVAVRLDDPTARIEVLRDGKPHLQWQGSQESLSHGDPCFNAAPRQLGLAVWGSTMKFDRVRFRPVSGKAWLFDQAKLRRDSPWPGKPLTGPVDLLTLVQPARDGVRGTWLRQENGLLSSESESCYLQIPWTPPEEYDVVVRGRRLSGNDCMVIGLVGGGRFFAFTVDNEPTRGFAGLELVDNRRVLNADNPTAREGTLLTNNKSFEITVAVRKDRVVARVDGQTIVDWPADYRRCRTFWEFPDRHQLGLGTWRSAYHFTALEIRPPGHVGVEADTKNTVPKEVR